MQLIDIVAFFPATTFFTKIMIYSHIPEFHGATDIADFYSATAGLHSGILFRYS